VTLLSLSKLSAAVTEGEKAFYREGELGPGVAERKISSLPKIEKPQTWEFSAHPHHSVGAAGTHTDLRLGNPSTGIAHSFVLPRRTELPGPGESCLVVPTYNHSIPYMDYTGPVSTTYGKGTVVKGRRTKAEVYHAEAEDGPGTKLRFNLYEGKAPEEFAIRRDQQGRWFLHNKTKTRGGRPDIPDFKPDYSEIDINKVDPSDSDQALMPKLDGAHVLLDLEAGRAPRVFSYRVAQISPTGFIEHTHKFPELLATKVPVHLDKTLVRAELMAIKKDGTPLSAETLGGILNSKVWESRRKQKELGVTLRAFPMNVVRYRGKDLSDVSFNEKLKVLRAVEKAFGPVEVPPLATTPEEKLELLNAIKAKIHPLTREGVVLVEPEGARYTKAKIAPDFDVHIRAVHPAISGETGKPHDRAGSVSYSWTPDGSVVGQFGGFSHDEGRAMLRDPDQYMGRVARVRATKVFKKGDQMGALFQPRFAGWHLDKGQIEKNAMLSGFVDELEKIAGLREAARVALTGRVPLYHGTRKALQQGILREGVMPQAAEGVSTMLGLSEPEKGLAFLTRSLPEAKQYAAQAVGVDRFNKLKTLLSPKLKALAERFGVKVPEEVQASLKDPEAKKYLGGLSLKVSRPLSVLPGGKRVVRANVPRAVVKSMEGPVPELIHGPVAQQLEELNPILKAVPEPYGKYVRKIPSLAQHSLAFGFGSTVPIRGGVPAKFIKGSPLYQGVTIPELKQHVRSVVADPKEFVKDVARSLTGFSHTPGTMLAKAKQGV
jgi:hypothetical protein